MTRLSSSLLLAAFLVALPACAGRRQVTSNPDAPLGRVIIYRNGVAYFERNAVVHDSLHLRVPRARVDDFLKSLTVTDNETGKPLPISYPHTSAAMGQWVDMAIALPPGRREVKITYVTESPAWKPSYRVILDDDEGAARMQSWAIVDNVSGERWDKVKVGVGSTSALSFRYDLHSVLKVERETLDTGTLLAQAPPSGGSPYAVDGDKVRVLANLSSEELAAAPSATGSTAAGSEQALEGRRIPVGNTTGRDMTQVVESSATAARDAAGISLKSTQGAEPSGTVGRTVMMEEFRNIPVGVEALRMQLAANDTRIRIEGYAIEGESEPDKTALRRANTLRERLVASGIASDRIDVVAGARPVASSDEVVQVVAVEDAVGMEEAVLGDVDPDQPRGTAHFVSDESMSLDPGHSAMVTLFDEPTEARRVYLYDPISSRGSKRYAFNAVRVVNPSDNTLDSGPLTVYARGRFLGEGLTEPVPPHEAALVPYALDRALVVEPEVQTEEQVERLVTVERGVATTQTRRTRRTRLRIDNRGHADAQLFVRHHVPSGWTLEDPPPGVETMGRDILVPVSLAAGAREVLTLEESMPVTVALDLRSSRGLDQIAVYLEAHAVAAPLRERLRAIVDTYRRMSTVGDELSTRHEQMAVLRERVGELESQLVGLREVRRAQELSAHLAERMKQLGDELDTLTVEVTELETDRLKAKIELQNLVAELDLREDEAPKGGTANAAP